MAPGSVKTPAQSDQTISEEASNAKFFGKRCTARLGAGEYTEALEDAKTLVRILPDATIGYLKAARCYRFLKKLKAAQKMLDMAVERADDEATIRAVRTEQRKLVEDSEKITQERSRPFSDRLPEEIFLHIASYLSQQDRIRAAQVNKTWRTVLHRHPHLWTAMYLHCNRQTSVQNLERHARRLHNQIRFYEDRLPENGSRKLETLSIHFEAALAPPKLPSDLLIVPLYLGKHRFIPTIRNISFTGSGALPWVDRLHHKWSVMPSLPDLRCVRLEVPNSSRPEDEYLPALLLARYPKLQALDIPAEGAITAEKDTKWPMQTAAMAKSSLKRLFVQGNMIAFDGRQDDQLHLEGLEHIDIGCASYSSLITKCALPHLRTLCLNNSLLYTCYTGTQPPPPFAESTRDLDTFLNSPLEFPVLETFKIVYTDPSWGYRFRPTDRQEVRPSLYLGRLKAPKLRSLTIKNFGASLSTPSRLHVRERRAWLDFCERHPQLEELVITKTAILELEQSIQCLPNLQKLLLSAVDLPAGVLKSATSPALPALRQLSVSNCSNITSGNLLRLVQSKNGKLEYLNIDGCTELQREAVDWLKNNVKEVKWSGWRDKNERRPFTLRS